MILNMGSGTASAVQYDNTKSGLEATNVQGAVDEVNERLVNDNGEEFRYGYQDGKRGVWVKEAGTDVFVPFKSGGISGKVVLLPVSNGAGGIADFDTSDLTKLFVKSATTQQGHSHAYIYGFVGGADGTRTTLLTFGGQSNVEIDITNYDYIRFQDTLYSGNSALIATIEYEFS